MNTHKIAPVGYYSHLLDTLVTLTDYYQNWSDPLSEQLREWSLESISICNHLSEITVGEFEVKLAERIELLASKILGSENSTSLTNDYAIAMFKWLNAVQNHTEISPHLCDKEDDSNLQKAREKHIEAEETLRKFREGKAERLQKMENYARQIFGECPTEEMERENQQFRTEIETLKAEATELKRVLGQDDVNLIALEKKIEELSNEADKRKKELKKGGCLIV